MIDGGLVDHPEPELIAKFRDRLADLRSCVAPATIQQLEEAVAELMLGFPSLRGLPKIEAQLMARKYATDLHGAPLWAVKAATADISRASVPGLNVDFPPTSPRLRSLVDGYVSPIHEEAREIKEVLAAKQVLPNDPAVVERVRALAKATITILNPPRPTGKGPTPQQIKAHYDAHDLEFKPRSAAAAPPLR